MHDKHLIGSAKWKQIQISLDEYANGHWTAIETGRKRNRETGRYRDSETKKYRKRGREREGSILYLNWRHVRY